MSIKTNYSAALALIVDRSGSMHNMVSDVKGSVTQFIEDQKKSEGDAALTLVQFDDQYEVIHKFENIKQIDPQKFINEYSPRGSTALLDAIGRTTIEMKQKLDALPEGERPSRVVVAIITDGYENCSHEYTIEKIKDLIKEQEAAGWDFMFMGATLDSIDVAKGMGFSLDKAAVYGLNNFKECMSSVSTQIFNARQNKEVKITDEERKNMVKTETTVSDAASPADSVAEPALLPA